MKRTSEHQLTKDNADAEDAASEQPQQFERAPPEVMAKRRIIKVKRTPNLVPVTTNTGPNPFATLAKPATIPVASTTPHETKEKPAEKPVETSVDIPKEKPVDDSEKEPEKPHQPEKLEETVNDTEKTVAEDGGETVENTDQDAKEKAGETPVEKKELEKPADTEVKSDQQPTTTATETPAEVAKSSVIESAPPSGNTNDAKPSKPETDTAPESSSSNPPTSAPNNTEASDETKSELKATNPTPALLKSSTPPNETAKPVIFGSATQPISFASAKTDGFNFKVTQPLPKVEEKKPEFKEAKVLTGEENDKELYRTRVKLYTLETSDGSSRWKERGVGSLKLNMNTETNKPRLLMRTEATLRVVLNSPVFKGFQIDRATDKTIRFQGFDVNDDKKNTSYLARFTSKDIASEMIAAIEKCKNDLK